VELEIYGLNDAVSSQCEIDEPRLKGSIADTLSFEGVKLSDEARYDLIVWLKPEQLLDQDREPQGYCSSPVFVTLREYETLPFLDGRRFGARSFCDTLLSSFAKIESFQDYLETDLEILIVECFSQMDEPRVSG